MAGPRLLEKFTSIDGLVSYTLPVYEPEQDSQQALFTNIAQLTGASYPYDMLQGARAPKSAGIEHAKFLILKPAGGTDLDLEADALRSKLFQIGRGKLYSLDAAAAERWAYARLQNMPTLSWRTADGLFVEAADLTFQRFSDWYATTPYSQSFPINADPQTITVPNTGLERVYNAVFILKGTYTNPKLTNTTNGYIFQSNRDGSAASNWLRFDAGQNSVQFSTTSGATYTGDYANYLRPQGQVQLFVLEPGSNSITLTGCNGATLAVSFYPAFD